MSKSRAPWHITGHNGRRPRSSLPIHKRYLIVTNGATEEIYFKSLRTATGPVVMTFKRPIDPISLVERAISERRALVKRGKFQPSIDETWVVMDRDTNPANDQDQRQFAEAMRTAKNSGIFVAYSNDSFELWFVLHFQVITSSTHRDDLCRILDRYLGKKYRKGAKGGIHRDIKHLRNEAIARAKTMEQTLSGHTTTPPWEVNPSTTVHILVERLTSDPGYRG